MTKNKQKLQQDQHKQQHHPERPKKVDKIKRKNNNNNVINISRNNFTNRNRIQPRKEKKSFETSKNVYLMR